MTEEVSDVPAQERHKKSSYQTYDHDIPEAGGSTKIRPPPEGRGPVSQQQ